MGDGEWRMCCLLSSKSSSPIQCYDKVRSFTSAIVHPPSAILLNFRFDHPELLFLLLLILPIGWLGWKHLATVEPIRRGLAIGLRVGVLVLLVLMLAGLRAERRHTDLTVIAVVDQSPSMSIFGQPPEVPVAISGGLENTSTQRSMSQAVRDFLVAASDDKQPDDRFGVVTYDNRPTVVTRPGNEVRLNPSADVQVREGTDTAKALEWAMAAKSDANTALRLVLVTDGNDTTGDTLAAARNAAAAGVVIDVLPIDYRVGDEVMVEGVYTPIEAREGQTVAVRVVLRGTAPARGQLQLVHDDRVLDLNGAAPGKGLPITPSEWSDSRALTELQDDGQGNVIEVEANAASESGRFVLAKQIDVPIGVSGANRFEAIFEPAVVPTPGMANNASPSGGNSGGGGASGGGTAGAIFNAANETAVQAFLEHRIRFGRIVELVGEALAGLDSRPISGLADVFEADREARRFGTDRLRSATPAPTSS